jgi:hypothetical protein
MVTRTSGEIGPGPVGAAVRLAAGTLGLVYGGFMFQVMHHLGTAMVTCRPSWRVAGIPWKMRGEMYPGIGDEVGQDEARHMRSGPRAPEIPDHRPAMRDVSQVVMGDQVVGVEMLELPVMLSRPEEVPGEGELEWVVMLSRSEEVPGAGEPELVVMLSGSEEVPGEGAPELVVMLSWSEEVPGEGEPELVVMLSRPEKVPGAGEPELVVMLSRPE